MDVLTNVLNGLELKGWLHSRTEFVPPWRFDVVASRNSIFHILSSGRGYLYVQGESTPLQIENGDVVGFPFKKDAGYQHPNWNGFLLMGGGDAISRINLSGITVVTSPHYVGGRTIESASTRCVMLKG